MLSTPVMAQKSDDDLPSVTLDAVVVTAEAQVKQSLGASMISKHDLERMPVKSDISEIVRKMPGVNLTGNSATGQRGNNRQIDIRGMGPENTLILIDGKPVTSRNSVRYAWRGERDTRGDSQWVPAEAIESIEVLRGPASARYGSGAMGGVVNIITKKITHENQGSVQVYMEHPKNDKQGASHRISASFSGPIIDDKLGFRIYGSYNKTDMDDVDINPLVPYYNARGNGYLTRAAGREGVKNQDLGVYLNYQITPNHALSFDAAYGRQGNLYAGDTQYSNHDASNHDTSDRTKASNAHLNSLIGKQTNIMRRHAYSLAYDGRYDWGDGKLTLQNNKTKNTRLNEGLAGGPEGVIDHRASHFEDTKLNTRRIHGEVNIPLQIKVPQKLTVGAEYTHDELIDKANMDEGTATGTDPNAIYSAAFVTGDRSQSKSEILSIYAENNLSLSNKTSLVLAGRYDHHNKSGGNFSPALNLTHHLDDHWTLKAGVAQAYKIPNLYQNTEGYLLGTRGGGCPIGLVPTGQWCVLQGNEKLKPETSLNTELGIQYQKDKVHANLTYFHNDYKNKIAAGTSILNTVTLPYAANNGRTTNMTYNLLKWENVPKAKVEGIEGSLVLHWGNIRWTNNITRMMKSVDQRTGNPLSLIPNYTYNSIIDYQITDDWDMNFTLTKYGRQKARQVAENVIENRTGDGLLHNKDAKGYHIASINTGYQFNDALTARIGINNIFDKQKLRDHNIGQTYNEPGRTYFAGLKYQF